MQLERGLIFNLPDKDLVCKLPLENLPGLVKYLFHS